MRALLRLPEPPTDNLDSSQSARQQQPKPKSGERYCDVWKRRNGIAPVGLHQVPPAEVAAEPAPCLPETPSLFPRDRRALEQKALALHQRGPRALAEFLIETVAARPEIKGDIHARLRRFNRIPPEVYVALSADKLPPPAVHAVADR